MKFTAALIAGGQSRRMGRDKAGVLYEGESLWMHQIATLTGMIPPPSELLISGRPGGPYRDAGMQIVGDEQPGRGPLGGVAAVLAAAVHDYVLVLAIDLPLITSEFLDGLVAEADILQAGIVVSDAGRFQPLAAIYTRACLPIARQCLDGVDYSMQRFIRASMSEGLLHEHPMQQSEVSLFRNLNTPADLKPG